MHYLGLAHRGPASRLGPALQPLLARLAHAMAPTCHERHILCYGSAEYTLRVQWGCGRQVRLS